MLRMDSVDRQHAQYPGAEVAKSEYNRSLHYHRQVFADRLCDNDSLSLTASTLAKS